MPNTNDRSLLKVAIVTGAGSGIGRAVALAFQKEGFSVVAAGRREAELLATARTATKHGARLLAVPTDVTQPDSVEALFAQTKAEFGRLDVLFNNAGTNISGVPTEDLTLAQWHKVMNVNLTGAFLCAQAAIRQMKAQHPGGGRIINTGSVSAQMARPRSAAYTASKHALTGLTKSIALDYRGDNIACGQIDVGNAATEMSQGIAAGALQADGTRKAEATIDARYVAETVLAIAKLPLDVNVPFVTVMANQMPLLGRG